VPTCAVVRTPGKASPDQPSPSPTEARASGLALPSAVAEAIMGLAFSCEISGLGVSFTAGLALVVEEDPKSAARNPFFFGASSCGLTSSAVVTTGSSVGFCVGNAVTSAGFTAGSSTDAALATSPVSPVPGNASGVAPATIAASAGAVGALFAGAKAGFAVGT